MIINKVNLSVHLFSSSCSRLLKRCVSGNALRSANDLAKLEQSLKRDGIALESGTKFKNIQLVTPRTFSNFLFTQFKLKPVENDEIIAKPGIELLRNIAANYDYWIVRNNQTHLLYYRINMLLQRIEFLESVGLDKRQKLRLIQKYPPLLLLTFTDISYDAKMIYLRGMLPKGNDMENFNHLFYPITNKLTLAKGGIFSLVNQIEETLGIKQVGVLRELLNIPCFFMDPIKLLEIDHLFIHKYSMPYYYDIDKHTSPVFPPVCNLPNLNLSATEHFSNKSTNERIGSLPTYQISDLLDYSYPTCNGKGTPECLSTFLTNAELEEEKDRTGGQPMKGRRGFNVPPRQY